MWWLFCSMAMAGSALATHPVSVDLDGWTGPWTLDGEPGLGDETRWLSPGDHDLELGGATWTVSVGWSGSVSGEGVASRPDSLALDTVTYALDPGGYEGEWSVPETSIAGRGTGSLELIPGAKYTLWVGQSRDAPVGLVVGSEVAFDVASEASIATVDAHRISLITREVHVDPTSYRGLWWVSAEPKTAQRGAVKVDVVVGLPYGVMAGLVNRYAFAFRSGLRGDVVVMREVGSGEAEGRRGEVRFRTEATDEEAGR